MTTLSKGLRAELRQHFTAARPELTAEQVSVDGTRKSLLRLPGGTDSRPCKVEYIYVPGTDRGTLGISSQVGFTLRLRVLPLRHAAPGTQSHAGQDRRPGRARARSPCRLAARSVAEQRGRETPRSNVVMMGMGEPLYNFEAVRDGLNIVADGDGLSISKRRITLSTSGVVPTWRAPARKSAAVTIALHAFTDEMHDQLVPLNRKYPLRRLLNALPPVSQHIRCAAHGLRICRPRRHRRFACRCAALVRLVEASPPGSTWFRSIPGRAPDTSARTRSRWRRSPK